MTPYPSAQPGISRPRRVIRRGVLVLVLALFLVPAAGCGKKGPPVSPTPESTSAVDVLRPDTFHCPAERGLL